MFRWFRIEYLFRAYVVFMFQLLLSGLNLLHPGVWWTSLQVSLIISPFVVNVWKFRLLRLFYPSKLAGLLLLEFLILQYFMYTRDIGTSLLGLIITFALCSLLYVFTYFVEKVIVLGLPPVKTVIILLIVTIISHFTNRVAFDICSYLKYLLVLYYVLRHSYIIQPEEPHEILYASIHLHVNFILVLVSVIVIMNHNIM